MAVSKKVSGGRGWLRVSCSKMSKLLLLLTSFKGGLYQGVSLAFAKCFLLRCNIVFSTSSLVDSMIGVGVGTCSLVVLSMYIFEPVLGSMCSSSFHVCIFLMGDVVCFAKVCLMRRNDC